MKNLLPTILVVLLIFIILSGCTMYSSQSPAAPPTNTPSESFSSPNSAGNTHSSTGEITVDPQAGYFVIMSEPPGGSCYFDYEYYGKTPVTIPISISNNNTHNIRITLFGYNDFITTYNGNPPLGETIPITAFLTQVTQTPSISPSVPPSIQLTWNSYEMGWDAAPYGGSPAPPGYQYMLVDLAVKNTGSLSEPYAFDWHSVTIRDPNNYEYRPTLTTFQLPDAFQPNLKIQRGETMRGKLVYSVPASHPKILPAEFYTMYIR